jgi:hypothetical protein
MAKAQHNNGMHPTRDTLPVKLHRRLGREGDAGRWAATLNLPHEKCIIGS